MRALRIDHAIAHMNTRHALSILVASGFAVAGTVQSGTPSVVAITGATLIDGTGAPAIPSATVVVRRPAAVGSPERPELELELELL